MTAILKVDLPASCVTEYWCKITRQQIIPAGFFYSRRAKKGTYDLDNDDARRMNGVYAAFMLVAFMMGVAGALQLLH